MTTTFVTFIVVIPHTPPTFFICTSIKNRGYVNRNTGVGKTGNIGAAACGCWWL